MSEMHELLREAAAMLRFQGELGLVGLDVLPQGARAAGEAGQTRAGLSRPTESAGPPGEPLDRKMPGPPKKGTPTAVEGAVAPSVEPAAVTLAALPVLGEPAARLAQIREAIGDCRRCKLHPKRTNIVYGVGSAKARLMFVGEAPGRDEDLQGEPFVGAAGQLLTKMIVAMGLKRSDVYIANVLKCRPPQNRDPEPDEVEACEPFLREQIRAIGPEVIVTLGRHAAHALLKETTPITRLRGTWRTYDGRPLMPTYHPAYLLRNPAEKKPVWDDLQLVMARLQGAAPRA